MRQCDRCKTQEGHIPYRIENNDLCQDCWDDFKRFFNQFLNGNMRE